MTPLFYEPLTPANIVFGHSWVVAGTECDAIEFFVRGGSDAFVTGEDEGWERFR